MENRNQIQMYFLNKIHGICVQLDMGGEGEEVTETGLEGFLLRNGFNDDINED